MKYPSYLYFVQSNVQIRLVNLAAEVHNRLSFQTTAKHHIGSVKIYLTIMIWRLLLGWTFIISQTVFSLRNT